MATSFAVIGLLGLLANWIFTKMKLPGLLGMLLVGMAIGPYGLNILDGSLIEVSADFRRIALIVILLRAGLGLKREDLHAVGITAAKMSVVPGVCEGLAAMAISHLLFGFSWIEGGIFGFILAAVSPAVIVPAMLALKEQGFGAKNRVPTLILASASVDDVVAITIFSAFLGLYAGENPNIALKLFEIPVSIILGTLLGLVIGYVLVVLFRRFHIRDTKKVLILVGASILLTTLETALKPYIAMASLLGVMAIGFLLVELRPQVAKRMALKLNKVWVFAEILLFVLVGAQVNTGLALQAGPMGLLLLVGSLSARSAGVWLATWHSGLTPKERWFSIMAFMPKATVQAAIGAIPLSLGVRGGDLMLAMAVLSILVTAPLGSLLLKGYSHILLAKEVD